MFVFISINLLLLHNSTLHIFLVGSSTSISSIKCSLSAVNFEVIVGNLWILWQLQINSPQLDQMGHKLFFSQTEHHTQHQQYEALQLFVPLICDVFYYLHGLEKQKFLLILLLRLKCATPDEYPAEEYIHFVFFRV